MIRNRVGVRSLALVGLLSALIVAWAHWPAFSSRFIINDDVRQQLFWMESWRAPALFQNDLLGQYAEHYVPWGVRAVYRLASSFCSPLQFSKGVAGLLFVALAALLFVMGRRLRDARLGWTMVLVFWQMPFFLDALSGGLARAFAAPLLALFLYAWIARRPLLVAAALVAQSLLIPYVFVLCATAWMLGALIGRFAGQDSRVQGKRVVIPALLVGAALVAGFTERDACAVRGALQGSGSRRAGRTRGHQR